MAAFFFGAHVEFLQGSSLGNWRDRGVEFGNCEDQSWMCKAPFPAIT